MIHLLSWELKENITNHNGLATPERKRCRPIGFFYYQVYLPHQAKAISLATSLAIWYRTNFAMISTAKSLSLSLWYGSTIIVAFISVGWTTSGGDDEYIGQTQCRGETTNCTKSSKKQEWEIATVWRYKPYTHGLGRAGTMLSCWPEGRVIRVRCPFPATRDDSGEHCVQATKECTWQSIHPDFEAHGESHPNLKHRVPVAPQNGLRSNKNFKKTYWNDITVMSS